MKFLIRESSSGAYQGASRRPPQEVSGESAESPANRLFFWWLHKEEITINDVTEAKRLVDACNKELPIKHEILELTLFSEKQALGGELLGYDVCIGDATSFLEGNLNIDPVTVSAEIRPLVQIVCLYFREFLNENGLFDDYENAKLFLDCLSCIEQIKEGCFELSLGVDIWRITRIL